jgi:L-amino acid N-acyltransferase YncA
MEIKDVGNGDLIDVFAWRKDPISCKMFTSDSSITLAEHKKWFESSLKNPLRKIYIGILKGEKVGVCRFDIDQQRIKAQVSINLNPNMRGKNLSFELLSESIINYKKDNQIKLTALIKKENAASLKIFQKCNFFIIDDDDRFNYLEKI